MKTKKRVAILGSTGSIGTQCLEVISECPEAFEAEVLTAANSVDLLIEQAKKYKPNAVVIANEAHYEKLNAALFDLGIKVYAGEQALCEIVEMESIDIVLTAMVGAAGLKPTIAAIEAKKTIALANKETMVVAGELITELALKHGVKIHPVDSEHSAIFQCLVGEDYNPIEKIVLTASGGPFRGKTREELEKVTKNEALKHPNWDMGAKISIDSASMINKGLEIIEAKWLFGLRNDQIEVVIHPESIVHSLVQFEDGSMKAQLGLPDMKLPILYGLSFPFRPKTTWPRFNFLDYPTLNFESPDLELFKNLKLAYRAINEGGNMPCVLNAANELVVQAFLDEQIAFLDMPEIIEEVMNAVELIKKPSLNQLLDCDLESRKLTKHIIQTKLNAK
ncbi:MAG: 1-deoxy-D-xylulose-5-phosphate reductoisomerase [Flavobacteriales bacterium]